MKASWNVKIFIFIPSRDRAGLKESLEKQERDDKENTKCNITGFIKKYIYVFPFKAHVY